VTDGPTSFGEDVPVAPTPATGPSALSGLLADFAAARDQHETQEFDVPGKPGVTIRYSTDLPYEMIAAWRKSAVGSPAPELRFGLSLLGYACRGILTEGEAVTDAGEPVTFVTPSLHAGLGVTNTADAVRAFYGKDAYILASYNAVLLAAGYGAEVSPTTR
jgi:hypothetical protein